MAFATWNRILEYFEKYVRSIEGDIRYMNCPKQLSAIAYDFIDWLRSEYRLLSPPDEQVEITIILGFSIDIITDVIEQSPYIKVCYMNLYEIYI